MRLARGFLFCVSLASIAAPALAQNVPVALVGPMTGPVAEAGKSMAAGASLAARDINARGGLNGAQIALSIENDEAATATARKMAESLAAKGVRHVIGHYTSAPTASADEIYIRHRMLLIAPSATSPGLPVKPGSPFLRLAPREEAQGQFAGEWLAREFPVGTLVVVQDGAVLSRNIARAAASAIGKARKEPAELRELPPASADAPGQAASLAQAIARGNVAAVYFAASPGNAAPFLRALRSAGSQIPVIASDVLATPEFAAATGEAVDELRMVVTANAAENEQAREIASRLKSEGVRDLNLALSNYAAVQILAEAAKRARNIDPDAMATAMRNAAPVTTIVGPISFDANGERRELPFVVVRWKRAADGKFLFAPD